MAIALSLCGIASGQSPKPPSDVKPVVVPRAVMKMTFSPIKGRQPIRLKAEKIIVLGLWATWSGPSKFALEGLNDLSQDFVRQGVTVVALTAESPRFSRDLVRSYVTSLNIRFPVGWVRSKTAAILMSDRGEIPQILLLSSDGVKLKRFIGWDRSATKAHLSEAIKEELMKMSGATGRANRN